MHLSEAAARGAENVIAQCLAVREGERIAILSWRTRELAPLLAVACRRVGAQPQTHDAEDVPNPAALVEKAIADASASVLLAAHGVPPALSMAMLDLARRRSLRHLHLTRADLRLFEQSYRAEPSRIADLNARIREVLARARTVEARGKNGTSISVQISSALPLLSSDGRPIAGKPDNLPSGFVFFHPASVSGRIVADRGLIGAIRVGRDRLARTPVTFEIEAGALRSFSTTDAALRAEIESYLAAHPSAGKVGLVSLPTNYLIRTESGLEVQDALLPGLGISLGYSDHEQTRAPFSCPIQLRILSRKLDVVAGGQTLVAAGRMADDLVKGIDPFR
ncbi:MAG: hypothetical protein U0326_44510 [Polyangiales bacterium]